MKKRFTEEQIFRILQEAEKAASAREVIRNRWENKYGAIDLAEARRL
jgi:hypothetical protein